MGRILGLGSSGDCLTDTMDYPHGVLPSYHSCLGARLIFEGVDGYDNLRIDHPGNCHHQGRPHGFSPCLRTVARRLCPSIPDRGICCIFPIQSEKKRSPSFRFQSRNDIRLFYISIIEFHLAHNALPGLPVGPHLPDLERSFRRQFDKHGR